MFLFALELPVFPVLTVMSFMYSTFLAILLDPKAITIQ